MSLEIDMKITLNGQNRDISESSTVEQLLHQLSLKGPLAVELNRKVCPKKLHTQTQLQPGDIVEIVTLVGGG